MEFSAYLSGLPFEQLAVIYQRPWTCLAVLRSLPSLSQQLVIRLLFLDEAISDSLLCGFVKPQYADRCSKHLEELQQLQVVQKQDDDCWNLEPTFRSATDFINCHVTGNPCPSHEANVTVKYAGSTCGKE